MIRLKSRDEWHASSESVLLEAFSQRHIQHLPTLLLLPMLMLPCSLYQPAAPTAATPAGVGYDVEADGRRVAKMSVVFREDLFTCTSAKCSSRVLLVINYYLYLFIWYTVSNKILVPFCGGTPTVQLHT